MPFAAQKQAAVREFDFLRVPLGECTKLPKYAVPDGYAAAIVNCKLVAVEAGRKRIVVPATRPGLSRVTSSAAADGNAVQAVSHTPSYTVMATTANLYYLNGSNVPVLVGSHRASANSRRPWLVNFAGWLILLDGGYPKYWDESSYNLLYDTAGYEFDYSSKTSAGSVALDSTGTTRAGQTETTPDWDAGLTLPTGPAEVILSKTGSPTGDIKLKVYDSSKSLVATSAALDAGTLTADPVEYTFTFDTAYLRSDETAYTYAVVYEGGDGTNQVKVHYRTVASGGGSETYNGSWSADATKDILLGLKPSLPPKGSWGYVYHDRLLIAGDPDNSSPSFNGSKVNYCNLPDPDSPGDHGPFYWGQGTLAGADAGSIAFDRGDGASITGLVPGFDGMIVFKGREPAKAFLLTGKQPGDYAVSPLPAKVSPVGGYALFQTANNVFFVDEGGFKDLRGVQTFGDVNYKPLSDMEELPVPSASDFGAVYGADDQILYKPAGDYTFVYHPRIRGWVRYKWGKGSDDLIINDLEFAIDDWSFDIEDGFVITPSGFGSDGTNFYLCGNDGHLYRFDQDNTYDFVIAPDYQLWSKAQNLGLARRLKHFKAMSFNLSSRGRLGASGKVSFRKDNTDSTFLSKIFNLPLRGDIDIDDLDLTIASWKWAIETTAHPDLLTNEVINFNAETLQVGIEDLGVLVSPLQIDGLKVKFAVLGER